MGRKYLSSPLIPSSPDRERILEIALLQVHLVDELNIRRMSVRAIGYIFHQQLLLTIRQEVSGLRERVTTGEVVAVIEVVVYRSAVGELCQIVEIDAMAIAKQTITYWR